MIPWGDDEMGRAGQRGILLLVVPRRGDSVARGQPRHGCAVLSLVYREGRNKFGLTAQFATKHLVL